MIKKENIKGDDNNLLETLLSFINIINNFLKSKIGKNTLF
jgi:hypothetical protein